MDSDDDKEEIINQPENKVIDFSKDNKKKEHQTWSEIALTDEDNQLFVADQVICDEVKVVWYIKGISKYWTEECAAKNTQIISKPFYTPDGAKWQLYLLPNGERKDSEFISVFLKALPNSKIKERSQMKRLWSFRFWYAIKNKQTGLAKGIEEFTMEDSEWGFSRYMKKKTMISNSMNNHFFLEWNLNSTIKLDHLRKKLHITAGIFNAGTTCYINSLLQAFFIIAPLRKAMFKMPTDHERTIPLCLQRIFYNLQFSDESIRITELLEAFGWSGDEINTQHDVTEFNWILSEKLEKKMEQIPGLKGTYSKIFEGHLKNHFMCVDVNHKFK